MYNTATVFDLLAARPRRRVLLTLCDVDSISVPDGLRVRGATATAQASGTSTPGSRSGDGSRDELALYHTHLPKLADCGYIDWDRDTQTVSRGPEFAAIEPLIHLLATNAHVLPSDFF